MAGLRHHDGARPQVAQGDRVAEQFQCGLDGVDPAAEAYDDGHVYHQVLLVFAMAGIKEPRRAAGCPRGIGKGVEESQPGPSAGHLPRCSPQVFIVSPSGRGHEELLLACPLRTRVGQRALVLGDSLMQALCQAVPAAVRCRMGAGWHLTRHRDAPPG
ncbi:hypothetical protein [Nonomuraea wenchangensis]|uniref:hypothetical protein n=1 Tax=Nonomuraea wenchangensis TaxID=568860 RepID=UPI0011604640|nr:hypothetical protein [Nonomuraea wenchangensis]